MNTTFAVARPEGLLARDDEILAEDLSCRQVSPGPEPPRHAEGTVHGTTRLRGDADGHALRAPGGPVPGGRNVDRLHFRAVREAEEEFLRTVLRRRPRFDLREPDREALLERRADPRREVRHRVEAGGTALRHPAHHLRGAEPLGRDRGDRLRELREGQAEEGGLQGRFATVERSETVVPGRRRPRGARGARVGSMPTERRKWRSFTSILKLRPLVLLCLHAPRRTPATDRGERRPGLSLATFERDRRVEDEVGLAPLLADPLQDLVDARRGGDRLVQGVPQLAERVAGSLVESHRRDSSSPDRHASIRANQSETRSKRRSRRRARTARTLRGVDSAMRRRSVSSGCARTSRATSA